MRDYFACLFCAINLFLRGSMRTPSVVRGHCWYTPRVLMHPKKTSHNSLEWDGIPLTLVSMDALCHVIDKTITVFSAL